VNVLDDDLQVLRQRPRFQLLHVVLVLLRLHGGVEGQLRFKAGVGAAAAVDRGPVQLGQEVLQVLERVLPIHVGQLVRLLPFLLVVGGGVQVVRGRGGGRQARGEAVAADAAGPGRPRRGLCGQRQREYNSASVLGAPHVHESFKLSWIIY